MQFKYLKVSNFYSYYNRKILLIQKRKSKVWVYNVFLSCTRIILGKTGVNLFLIFKKHLLNMPKSVHVNENIKNYTNIFIYWNQMKISECTKYLEVWSAIKIAALVTVLLNY